MEASEQQAQDRLQNELEIRFDQLAAFLRDIDIEAVWTAAEEHERRVLVEELVEAVGVYPDHLEVTVAGAPPLNVLYGEVGLKESYFCWCRRGALTINPPPSAWVTEVAA